MKYLLHLFCKPITIEFEKNIERQLRDLEETFIMVCMGLSLDSL